MLDFILDEIICAEKVDVRRVFKLNNVKISEGDIIYVMSRELRLEDNWAVVFGLELAEKYSKKFKVIVNPIKHSKKQESFLRQGLNFLKENLALNNIDFKVTDKIPKEVGALIFDFNPINKAPNPNQPLPKHPPDVLLGRVPQGGRELAMFEVDSHNIIPARFISQKQEFSAATLRRKVYANIADFLTEFPLYVHSRAGILASQNSLLQGFINNKLDYYVEFKNSPNNDVTSHLSPYLHFGFISSQRVALEVIKSSVFRENKEAFLEELIVRKELADNFCLYSPSFNAFDGILNWAKETLNVHKEDIRSYIYSLDEFEQAKTHDELWNKIQRDLLDKGRIHGYLRMYWAKKILEWSISPEEALRIAIYLNDAYALDGNDPNGYVGILWSIGGLHDRPFANRLVTGKIRYMSLNGIKSRFDVNKYIKSA